MILSILGLLVIISATIAIYCVLNYKNQIQAETCEHDKLWTYITQKSKFILAVRGSVKYLSLSPGHRSITVESNASVWEYDNGIISTAGYNIDVDSSGEVRMTSGIPLQRLRICVRLDNFNCYIHTEHENPKFVSHDEVCTDQPFVWDLFWVE